jgi:cell division protein FtsN
MEWKRHRKRNNKSHKPVPDRSRLWIILAAVALSVLAVISLMKWLKGSEENSVPVSVAPVSKPAKTIPLQVPPSSVPPPVPKVPEKKPVALPDAVNKSQEPATPPPAQPVPGPDAAVPVVAPAPEQKKVGPVKLPEPRFTFYKILPDQEVIIPDPDIRMLKQSAPPSANTQYTLQVASSLQLDDAKNIQVKLSQIKVKSQIESVEIENALWYRVKVGPFKDLDRADQVKAWLRNNKIDSVVQKKIEH